MSTGNFSLKDIWLEFHAVNPEKTSAVVTILIGFRQRPVRIDCPDMPNKL
jgi:hypothetical protein